MCSDISGFMVELYQKRTIVLGLAVRSFKQQYMGSALGLFWAILEPLIFISILYTIFSIGLKSGPVSDMPFSVYLISGMVAWLYFSNTLSRSLNSVSEYAYLVNNAEFRNDFLPIVNLVSNMMLHVVFVVLAIVVAWVQGYHPTLYTFQVIYYFFAMVVLLLGLSWITSATNIFLKDVSKIVAIMIQFGFWLTPIFWNINMVPEKYHWMLKLNPILYVVQGYRESLVLQTPFWHHPWEMLFYWVFALMMLVIGGIVFNKLQPHFGDML